MTPSICFGADSKRATILLTDGSQLTGQILSSGNGKYTISVDSLGTLIVDQKQIESIHFQTGKSDSQQLDKKSASDQKITNEMVESAKRKVMSDPKSMEKVMYLAKDPAFQAILDDAEIMSMIELGDFNGLMKHPKIQALSQNPKFQDLSKGMD